MGFGHRLHNLFSIVVLAEATVVVHGLQFVKELGFSKIILESDSKTVIKKHTSSKGGLF